MNEGLFISYRRSDSQSATGRLADHLRQNGFGGEGELFLDVDQRIRPGADFREVIDETLAECDLVIVVIGRHWLDAADSKGRRRLDRSSDTHRLEVAAALGSGAWVIPVLVEGASHPSEDDLPDDLNRIAYLQSWELGERNYATDVASLAESMLEVRQEREARERADAAAAERERQAAEQAVAEEDGREQAAAAGKEREARERADAAAAERERQAAEQAVAEEDGREQAAAAEAERERVAAESAAAEREREQAAEEAEGARVAAANKERERAAAEEDRQQNKRDEAAAEELERLSALHDEGKLTDEEYAIARLSALHDEGKLTDEEYAGIRRKEQERWLVREPRRSPPTRSSEDDEVGASHKVQSDYINVLLRISEIALKWVIPGWMAFVVLRAWIGALEGPDLSLSDWIVQATRALFGVAVFFSGWAVGNLRRRRQDRERAEAAAPEEKRLAAERAAAEEAQRRLQDAATPEQIDVPGGDAHNTEASPRTQPDYINVLLRISEIALKWVIPGLIALGILVGLGVVATKYPDPQNFGGWFVAAIFYGAIGVGAFFGGRAFGSLRRRRH